MRNRIAFAIVLTGLILSANGQWLNYPDPRTPRTPGGKPNLTAPAPRAADGKPEVILMGTGSEVALCVAAYEQLKAEGIKARVVSMPSWDIFEKQSAEYKKQVLPPAITARISVEAASTFGWSQYVGPTGKMIGMHRFGASAPIKDLLKKFGFTAEKVVEAAREAIELSK